jgi:hypothetical protein
MTDPPRLAQHRLAGGGLDPGLLIRTAWQSMDPRAHSLSRILMRLLKSDGKLQ